jgi:hypothetical protein
VSVNADGEHVQQIWLSDSELELVKEAIGLYLTVDEHWPSDEVRAKAEALSRRLEG